MSWLEQQAGDTLSWLLDDETPDVRYLTLRDLLDYPRTNPELMIALTSAHTNGSIAKILNEMEEPGYWVEAGPGYYPKYRSTVWSVVLLAQLGASLHQDQRIERACTYLLDHALTKSGQFTASGAPSGTADCIQGNLTWALLELGCEDPRMEVAFDWMARSVTGEGVAQADNRSVEARYYAGKCGPVFACGSNNRMPCAWGGTKVMIALSKWPKECRTPLMTRAIEQGVEFFFSVNPAEATYPSGFSEKPSRNWWKFGFPVFYVTDLLQTVEALTALGYGTDNRLSQAINIIREKQDEMGRWALEYDYADKIWVDFGEKNKPNKWVTLRAMRVLKAIEN